MARRTVLVTGSSRGIGAAVAERAASDGWDVAVHYLANEAGAQATVAAVEAAGGQAAAFAADLAAPDAAASLVTRVTQRFGRLDAVVNNAGVYERAATGEVPLETAERAFEVNLLGTYRVTKAAWAGLPSGGRVVNVSSILAQAGTTHGAHYAAAKGGVEALTRAWALELAPRTITVNCVAPGATDTDILAGDSPEKRAERERVIALGRVARPADIAGVVAFLLGPDSAYVTGHVLAVNGGWRV